MFPALFHKNIFYSWEGMGILDSCFIQGSEIDNYSPFSSFLRARQRARPEFGFGSQDQNVNIADEGLGAHGVPHLSPPPQPPAPKQEGNKQN